MDFAMIKQRAKNALSSNYWPLVGLVLLAGLLGATSSSMGFSFSFGSGNDSGLFSEGFGEVMRTFAVIGGIAALAFIVFVGNAVQVGLARVCINAYEGRSFGITDLFRAFRDGRYWRVVGAMALNTLFITLGLLLFIVPGIIVALGLFPLPYMLAEDDSLSGMEAIRRAWDRSNGYKGNIFLFELSFIGWMLLNALTFGILGLFYVNPYFEVSLAGYYTALTCRPAYGERAY